MAKFYPQLTPDLTSFIQEQKIFFTATAPNSGKINLSPKGMDTFRCLDHHTVGYLDLTGSGNETSAHLQENGRITIMFCSFTEKPLILRIYGQGKMILPRDPEWDNFYHFFTPTPGERQIIIININGVQTSCGYAVPLYDLKEERQQLITWSEKKGLDGIKQYWHDHNQVSLDGLPTHII